jgi:hypothetical protein
VVSRAGGRQGDHSTPTFAVNSDDNVSGVPRKVTSVGRFYVQQASRTRKLFVPRVRGTPVNSVSETVASRGAPEDAGLIWARIPQQKAPTERGFSCQ